jgi:hypothetical protein
LEKLEAEASGVSFGSYPWFSPPDGFGLYLVARTADVEAVKKAAADLAALIRAAGGEPEEVDAA